MYVDWLIMMVGFALKSRIQFVYLANDKICITCIKIRLLSFSHMSINKLKKNYIYCIKNDLGVSLVTSNISLTSACSSHIAATQLSSGQRSGEFIGKYGRSPWQRPHMRLESYERLQEIKVRARNIYWGVLLHCFISLKP